MKKTILQAKFNLILASIVLAMFTGCSPQKNAQLVESTNSQSGIIGGQTAPASFAQKVGVVGIYDLEEGGLCTGTLIHSRLVLTAGHCATSKDPKKILTFFGDSIESIAKEIKDKNFRNIRHVANYIRNENYISQEEYRKIIQAAAALYRPDDPKLQDIQLPAMNDIAVFSLEADAPGEYSIAKFPTTDLLKSNNLKLDLTFAGYGVNEVIENKNAKRPEERFSMKGSGLLRVVEDAKFKGFMSKTLQEFNAENTAKGTCAGDSGGPAYIKDSSGNYYLFGITSRGDQGCSLYGTYTTVSTYLPWINETAKKLLLELKTQSSGSNSQTMASSEQ